MIGADDKCLPQWKRDRSIACIMSSDCYRLKKAGEDPTNYIGFRHTWIRVNHPSVESLRQAFLDHESRIRFGESSPDLGFDYPKIRSVRIQNATYLRRLESINWSPNLNCLISSRGTGKSTLVDYMRLALDQMRDEDLPESF